MFRRLLLSLLTFFCILPFCNLYSEDTVVIDHTGLDYQYYGWTGTFGPQILVDQSGKVHVSYVKTWVTETDTGWVCRYANVSDSIYLDVPNQESTEIDPGHVFIDGGHNTPVYLFYGMGSRFYGYSQNMHQPAMARVSADGASLEPLGMVERPHIY